MAAPRFSEPRLRDALADVSRAVAEAGGRALWVGGCLRDTALGRPITEVDVEVFGMAPGPLAALLGDAFGARVVGRGFPVLKLAGLPIDVSVPRRGVASSEGRRRFEDAADPEMSLEEALARRDFTCNAMAFDPATGIHTDPFGGAVDLEAGVLRHTSERFGEDPIRVLRGVQHVARFDLSVAPETLALFRQLAPGGAPVERVGREWRKLLLAGDCISRGLATLADANWLRFFPELEALVGCPQDPVHHPEGDVWVHTGHCLDAFARDRSGDSVEDWIVGLAVLCHDLGKPTTTLRRQGRLTAWRHDAAGAELARSFLARLTDESAVVEAVTGLVAAHLAPSQLYRDRAGDAAVRRLARAVGRIDRLLRVAAADHAGRPPRSDREPFAAGPWLLERARTLEVEARAPEPLLRGRDLLALGLTPGPEVGRVLEACYEAQIDGEIASREEGLVLAQRLIGRS